MFGVEKTSTYTQLFSAPTGFKLARAIGLTYSLDLETLFASLMGLAQVEHAEEDDSPAVASSLLPVILDLADRVTVICQRGKMRRGRGGTHQLHKILDQVVREADPPKDGSFHPKVWLLKFESQDSSAPFFRVIVSSRNLAASQSFFESAACLEGAWSSERRGNNADLVRFLEAAAKDAPDIGKFLKELGGVEFLPVKNGASTEFHYQLGNKQSLSRHLKPQEVKNVVVVSPFLSAGFLGKFLEHEIQPTVVSTWNALEMLPPEVSAACKCFAIVDRQRDDDESDGPRAEGLHAKIIVAERKGRAEVWLGSANATHRAWEGVNVEAMVVLGLPGYSVRDFKSELIYENIKEGKHHRWIQPVDPSQFSAKRRGELQLESEISFEMDSLATWIALGAWSVELEGNDTVVRYQPNQGQVRPVLSTVTLESVGVGLLNHEASLEFKQSIDSGGECRVEGGDIGSFTQLLSIRLKFATNEDAKVREVVFLLKAQTSFADWRRRDQVLLKPLLGDADGFRRCLRFLVEDYMPDLPPSPRPPDEGDIIEGAISGAGKLAGVPIEGILEPLLRKCVEDPSVIDRVQRLVDLSPPESRDPEFKVLFDAILLAMGKEKKVA